MLIALLAATALFAFKLRKSKPKLQPVELASKSSYDDAAAAIARLISELEEGRLTQGPTYQGAIVAFWGLDTILTTVPGWGRSFFNTPKEFTYEQRIEKAFGVAVSLIVRLFYQERYGLLKLPEKALDGILQSLRDIRDYFSQKAIEEIRKKEK
ncbi:MAG: hypothetical protein ACXADX_07980 [Candidatus Hodarchaeales archaeon]